MPDPQDPFNPPKILDPSGLPARKASDACPRCGAGKEKRVASSGFGPAHPVCNGGCSPAYEWTDEVFQ